VTRKVLDTLLPYVEADPENTVKAFPVIARLLSGQPLTEEFWEETQRATRLWDWKPVLPRTLRPGDVVRVRHDAYDGASGRLHNGREGRVLALRGGIIIGYMDASGKRSTGMGIRHEMGKLERRVPVEKMRRTV